MAADIKESKSLTSGSFVIFPINKIDGRECTSYQIDIASAGSLGVYTISFDTGNGYKTVSTTAQAGNVYTYTNVFGAENIKVNNTGTAEAATVQLVGYKYD